MTEFQDLPLEALPQIVQHIVNPEQLASLCLVHSTFRAFALPKLYTRIKIYSWHKESKSKVLKLFSTLALHPPIARLVERLEIRDFPKALTSGIDILDDAIQGLKNCTNLISCTWTRDGSLNSEILQALQRCPGLRELEINGHNEGHYDPRLLLAFTQLHQISIIMPDITVASQLRPWLAITGSSLRSLKLVCKASSIITDGLLKSLAEHLANLEHFNLAGCPKVTHEGIWAIISANVTGLNSLGLEGMSTKFDMTVFSDRCTSHGALRQLNSFTMTASQTLLVNKRWVKHIVDLLSYSPLQFFQVYSTEGISVTPATNTLWDRLLTSHGERLVRFSVHRILLSIPTILDICLRCPNLEQLFIVIQRGETELDALAQCMQKWRKLRILHINFPMEQDFYDFPPDLDLLQALSIVGKSSTLTQFGCNATVWQVKREVYSESDGSLSTVPVLEPYESLDIPEQFLVVKV